MPTLSRYILPPTMATIPEGFELIPPFGPSHEMVGPIYAKQSNGEWTIGMWVEPRHHNRGPMMHGGMMAFSTSREARLRFSANALFPSS